jgi:1,6-anhydro-N-acetylmuramate kinase
MHWRHVDCDFQVKWPLPIINYQFSIINYEGTPCPRHHVRHQHRRRRLRALPHRRRGIVLRALWSARFPAALRETLHAAARGDLKSHQLAQAHHDLGRFYARHALFRQTRARRPTGRSARPNRLPQPVAPPAGHPATWRTGLPGRAPARAGHQQFPRGRHGRRRTRRAPGHVFHQCVFARRGRHICVNNLGGISNVTSLDWRQGPRPAVLAFDTGPANVLIDLAMRALSRGKLAMDRNGSWAARGTPCEPLVRRWLEHDYFRQSRPRAPGANCSASRFSKRPCATCAAWGVA